MRTVHDLTAVKPEPSVVTLGTFDGIHRGHRLIIESVCDEARRNALRSVLVTFDPHPREVLRHDGERIYLLTTLEERLRILNETPLDLCIVLAFTRDLSLLEADEFFHQVLVERIGARHLVVGSDHAFGKGRRGRIEQLLALGAESGVVVTAVPELVLPGGPVSSTAIRRALHAGDMRTAWEFLGRPYTLSGVVQRGEGLGRRIGFPTANIRIASERKLVPLDGVYAARVRTPDGIDRAAMVNIGRRPTVSDDDTRSVEAHILDFDGDLYGACLEAALMERLRDTIRFPSVEELARKLAEDEREVRRLLATEDLSRINNRIHT
ncbi:MAG: bifunctional riboflavin kinase/FAD synthetase [Bacteroidota bacterium]|nr:bifunctional riboflavin kinase/FAD synthetase [Bacteroidota bacterium]